MAMKKTEPYKALEQELGKKVADHSKAMGLKV